MTSKKPNNSPASQTCAFCKENHFVGHCKKFSLCSQSERVEFVIKTNLCRNCLKRAHSVENCTAPGWCYVCNEKHNTKLHVDKPRTDQSSDHAATTSLLPPSSNKAQDSVFTALSRKTVLMGTAHVQLKSPEGRFVTVRALLDPGAEDSFLSEQVVQILGLQRKLVTTVITGVGGEATTVSRSRVDVILRSTRNPTFSLKFSGLVLKKLTTMIPRHDIAYIT